NRPAEDFPSLPKKVCYSGLNHYPKQKMHPRASSCERKDTMRPSRTASEWFASAAQAYSEKHQGCAWCGNVHCVRQTHLGTKRIFNCQRCDFQIGFDAQTNRHHLIHGEELSIGPETMLEQPIANLM